MAQSRDLTKAQFDAACERRGFKRTGFMGYYEIGYNTSVSVLNAGRRRRDQLAYLIREAGKAERWFLEQQGKDRVKV